MARNGEAGHAGIFGEGKKMLDTKELFAVKEFLEENLMEILTRLNRLEGIDELFNVIVTTQSRRSLRPSDSFTARSSSLAHRGQSKRS